jgi:signal transduction histidine kinase/DNA-binding response OmpR family regulator
LPSDNVYSIHADRNGNIWVGVGGGGLCLFNNNTNKFTSYSESEGLSNGVIYKILEDDAGKLWVSTNKGISSFDPKNRKFKNYSYYNGLQQSTFYLGAGLKTTAGEMFFGGLGGFNYFNPRALNSNRNVPSLVLTDLKISNRSVIPGKDSPIKKHISVAKEIRLSYKQNFSLDFVALNYTAPQESQYSYKLDGFDKDWNQAGPSKTAVYTNLDPGKYIFRLKAGSDDGLWNTPETSITIYVSPPFWRTAYAYAFYILAAGLILWGMRYRGIRKLKNKFALEQERLQVKQMIEQERKEAARKHEFDQVKIKFLTNLSHEFRTPIALIVEPTEKLLQQEGNGKKLEQLSLIRRNARRLLNLVNQLLDFRKLEENELKLNLTEDDLVSFVRDVGDSFKDISDRKRINFAFTSSLSHFYTSFDRDKIERILFNLLSNAFKFTQPDGKIWLKIEQDFASGIRIIIADTGIGMTRDIQEKIFERFFQGDANTSILNQGNGIGLSITREFVKLHGGTINVESIHGKGSIFTVELPCKPIPKSAEELALSRVMADSTIASEIPKAEEASILEMPTVLLIEDHDDFRNYLSENLKSHYKIVEASDGKEGWQKALSTHPQIIVSDINMPEMDGIMLCRKIKSDKRTNHIPIILLTALTGDANQLRGLNTGASDYLTKPFNFEILNIKIRNLLNLNQNLKNVYSRQLKVVTPEIEIQSEDEKLLLKITQYIESNIDNPDLSVEELSKHVFMSRGSLYSKIITLTGETPVEFIRSIKLNKAATLLENTDMKISQVGYEVGFTTANYFARAFKAKFNLSPTEYVNLKRKTR